MKYSTHDIERIIDYYINQVFKILYLFEEGNKEGYKHVQKVLDDLEELVSLSPSIQKDMVGRMQIKLNRLYKYMFNIHTLDNRKGSNDHQKVKNTMFECRNILLELKEGVLREDA